MDASAKRTGQGRGTSRGQVSKSLWPSGRAMLASGRAGECLGEP